MSCTTFSHYILSHERYCLDYTIFNNLKDETCLNNEMTSRDYKKKVFCNGL